MIFWLQVKPSTFGHVPFAPPLLWRQVWKSLTTSLALPQLMLRTFSGVSGYSCNEKILDQAPTQFSAKATCKKGSKKFKQTFGENT
jgi:hypothetical protein